MIPKRSNKGTKFRPDEELDATMGQTNSGFVRTEIRYQVFEIKNKLSLAFESISNESGKHD